jgi:GGDEF domain-containing protein
MALHAGDEPSCLNGRIMLDTPSFSSTDLQALVIPTDVATEATQYRLLAMVDIDGMADLNRELGWQHGNDAIASMKFLLRTRTPDGDVWRTWRGDKFVAALEGCDATMQWLADLPTLALRRTRTPITVCAIALNSPTSADIGLLAQCMVKAKRTQRGRAYVHDIRAT